MSEPAPYVVETAEDFAPDTLFQAGREQVVLAVRITPVYGQIDLTLVARVVDAATSSALRSPASCRFGTSG